MTFFFSILIFILGVFATQILEYYGIRVYASLFNSIFERRKDNRQRRAKSLTLHKWLIKYYKNRLDSHFLYKFELQDTTIDIPFITKDTWIASKQGFSIILNLPKPVIKSNVIAAAEWS